MTASISHHAQCRHTLAAIATRRYTLTAIATHCPPHGRGMWRHATRSRPSLYAVTRSLPLPYTATWPPRALCYSHSRHYTPPLSRYHRHTAPHTRGATRSLTPPHTRSGHTPPRSRSSPRAITRAAIATRSRSLAAIATRRHMAASSATLNAHGRHYTPPRSLPSPHAADMSHAAAQLNMARMLHVPLYGLS